MPGNCPASLRPTAALPVENIPLQAERHSGRGQKLFAFPPESRSPSDRNAVRIHNGMMFGFRTESRSPSTGFPTNRTTLLTVRLIGFRPRCINERLNRIRRRLQTSVNAFRSILEVIEHLVGIVFGL